MARIYPILSASGSGKTTTSVLLREHFEQQGYSVANIQSITKGRYDTGLYLKRGSYHYSIPIQATKNKTELEKWLPKGYDIFTLEISTPYILPTSATRVSLFDNVNELVPYEFKDLWQEHLLERFGDMPFHDVVYNRNVKTVVTKSPVQLNDAGVSDQMELFSPDKFIYDNVTPRMELPVDQQGKKVIAVGSFPAEYWDIYPNLQWFGQDWRAFMTEYKNHNCDLAIMGDNANSDMRIKQRDAVPTICYNPKLFRNVRVHYHKGGFPKLTNRKDVFQRIKNNHVGSTVGEDGCVYECMNNEYWIRQRWQDFPLIEHTNNLTICNGWILPQMLIQDGYLEV